MKKLMLMLIAAAFLLSGDEPKKPSSSNGAVVEGNHTHPTVSIELRAKLWRLYSDQQTAELKYHDAESNLNLTRQLFSVASGEWATVCGDKYDAKLDTNGEPACIAKEVKKEDPPKDKK